MELNHKFMLGAALQDCIHVAGILNFFRVMESFGYQTRFIGPAVDIQTFTREISNSNAGSIGVSYRLTPRNGITHVKEFMETVQEKGLEDRTYYLGCLPDLAKEARKLGFFDAIFTGGETLNEVLGLLGIKRQKDTQGAGTCPQSLVERITWKAPYPVLRAHFGLPSLQDTLDGVARIAKDGSLDIISIAPDQACQESLHRPGELGKVKGGAGGVPIRSRQHLEQLYEASRQGNHPLLRIYSGTRDLLKNASLFKESINNAWAAIPLFWYSELDGRGPSNLRDALDEHVAAIKWHAKHGIPVEINDPHQWGLRMAPDHVVVADAFLCANMAKFLGVRHYIEQIMFNTPTGNSLHMDLARALAMVEIVQPLMDDSFTVLKQTRAGLAYLSPREPVAMGQLCTSTLLQLSINPHIMHVVSYCEGDHAARPEDISKSCMLISRVIQDGLHGLPDMLLDPRIQQRKEELLVEAYNLITGILELGHRMNEKHPLTSLDVLHEAVKIGILDAPQIGHSTVARGEINARIVDGKCIVASDSGKEVKEEERLKMLGINIGTRKENQSIRHSMYEIHGRGEQNV
ncbi:methionine synthase [Candidatus Bathyarchaeota archaeon]|nr:methionine synthase [Candidatus Bathyarchaeota archaeon]